MSDQIPPQEPVTFVPPPPPVEDREEDQPKRRGDSSRGWIGGAVLILLGAYFLLQNFGIAQIDNWWALFILIPAIGSFATAWSSYQRNGGRMNSSVRGSLVGGLILTLVTATFLFNLDWALVVPGFLIIIGLSLLVSNFVRS